MSAYCTECYDVANGRKTASFFRKKRRYLKTLAVEYKGGKCERCGYNGSIHSLQFHHLDPAEKDFEISECQLLYLVDAIKAELDKTILLCANCHAEEHQRILLSNRPVKQERMCGYYNCTNVVASTRAKYCSPSCKNKFNVSESMKNTKLKAAEYKGGKCELCGYDKCKAALTFHHIDPEQKSFAIGVDGYTRSWEKIRAEVDKCNLLCQNCHRKLHEKAIE